MKIVIDIPDCMYEVIKKSGSGAPKAIDDAIINGTPLPKNHGRIIDESTITACEWYAWNGLFKIMTTNAPTIIEAESEKQ